MRKKIFSVALILGGLIGFNASAQTPVEEVTETVETVQEVPGNVQNAVKEMRDGRRHDRRADKGNCSRSNTQRREGRGDRQRPDLFEGIELTADQQTKINALKQSCRRPENCNKDQNAQCKDEKNCDKGDRPDKVDRQAMRRQYLDKVKEILTPDQYVKFLENSFLSGGGHGGQRPHHGGQHHGAPRR